MATELEIAMQGPAIASNSVTISITEDGVRLAFLESYGQEPASFRAAVMLSHSCAIALYKLLQKLIQERQK